MRLDTIFHVSVSYFFFYFFQVRFVESLDPSLAVILGQSSRMAIKLDPTLQMFNTCAYLAGVPSECELKVQVVQEW